MKKTAILTAAAILVSAGAANAQVGTTSTSPNMPVTGSVPILCAVGTVSGNGDFPLGTLIDTATGKMRQNITADPRTISGSWCNAPSTISISATQLTAQNSTGTLPGGFSRTLNYTATASGFSALPATFVTGSTPNSTATRNVTGPLTAPITVTVSAVTPVGDNPFLVADSSYRGTVTVTLAVQAISGT